MYCWYFDLYPLITEPQLPNATQAHVEMGTFQLLLFILSFSVEICPYSSLVCFCHPDVLLRQTGSGRLGRKQFIPVRLNLLNISDSLVKSGEGGGGREAGRDFE